MRETKISTQRVRESRLAGIDFDNLAFGREFADHMVEIDSRDGVWGEPTIVPYGPIAIEPSMSAIHYGQSIFEGMKATLHRDGRAMLWRPEQHARRLNHSAERMAMPTLPEETFLETLHALVDLDKGWIPPKEGSALYVRPFMFATDNTVGVRPSTSYKYMVITSPVGPYYNKPVRLLAQTSYIRAAMGGVGEAKTAGNYAAAMLPSMLAQREGYDQILWLDAKELRYVQEVGTMNIFFVIDGRVVTPNTPGTILRGITRKTVMQFMREAGHEVEERPITIDELVEAHRSGHLTEAFGTGTAAVVSPVADITYGDYHIELPDSPNSVASWVKDKVNGVRSGRLPDAHGWLVEAGSYARKSAVASVL